MTSAWSYEGPCIKPMSQKYYYRLMMKFWQTLFKIYAWSCFRQTTVSARAGKIKTRIGHDFVTIQNRNLKLKVSDFNLNQFVLLSKSTVKIWAKLNIRNLVKNYPVHQVRSWICDGLGLWQLINFSHTINKIIQGVPKRTVTR